MNLDYYHKVFNGNPEKIKRICTAIINDFRENEIELKAAISSHNVLAMRKVLHKMSPIAESLQYHALTQTIERFKESNYDLEAAQQSLNKIQDELNDLYIFLEKSTVST